MQCLLFWGMEGRNMLEEILRVYVELEDAVRVDGNVGSVNMIRFTGYAESRYFQGKILPGGVDLQRSGPGGRTNLSARYILEGMDSKGIQCRIFIENNGVSSEDGIIKTNPVIVTDSRALGWMETAVLDGNITFENDKVIIHIYRNM